jgi:hypothetical protein
MDIIAGSVLKKSVGSINPFAATHYAPADFTVARTGDTTLAVTVPPQTFTATNTLVCYLTKKVTATGVMTTYVNGVKGVSLRIAADNTIELLGATVLATDTIVSVGIKLTRYLAAVDSGAQTITSATYAIIHATAGIIDLKGMPGAALRIVTSDGTTTDKVAIQIWGSVDGTTFSDVWHPILTGRTDPYINDYGAQSIPVEIASGVRKIAIYAKRTAGVAGDGTVQVVWQAKPDPVAVNSAALIKSVVDACVDIVRGDVAARIQNWPSNNIAPINFVDTTNVASGTTYYPSSTGASLAAIQDLSITGNILAGANNTVKLQIQATNDEDTAAGWKTIYFKDDVTGGDVKEIVAALAGTDFAITGRKLGVYANYRLALICTNTGVASNTVIIKGNSVGGA